MKQKDSFRSSMTRKVSHFEKYRKELERISDEMNKSKSNSVYSSSSSEFKQPSKLVTTSDIKLANSITITPKPPSRKVSYTPEPPTVEIINATEIKQDVEQVRNDKQLMKQVELLVQHYQSIKNQISRAEEQIQAKKKDISELRRQISVEYEKANNREAVNYSEKILAIETRVKFKKELHQDELHRLVNQKNSKHFDNVQLSKFAESLEEQLSTMKQQLRKSEMKDSVESLQQKQHRMRNQLARLEQQYVLIQEEIDNKTQIENLSRDEFKRHCQVYTRQLIGKEISHAEDRIKERNNDRRFSHQTEKKKNLVKDRKVELQVLTKTLVDVTRLISLTKKEIQIEQLKNEIHSHHQKKLPSFKDDK